MGIDNTTRTKLTGKRIGVMFGTFAPLHYGHQQEIYAAAAQNDAVILITSGYKGDRGESVGLDLIKRFRYLREAYNDEPTIQVSMINEDNIPKYIDKNHNGWKEWAELFVETVRASMLNPDAPVEYTVYTGDIDYVPELETRMPALAQSNETWRVKFMDRTAIPVSGTMIRDNPMKYWQYINRVFRRAFTKKVLVVGASSSGKSTLVRRLARSLNAPFSEEYARVYEQKMNLTDDELQVNDYISFFEGQDRANQHEIESPANQGIVFFDTDAITTKCYARMYLPVNTREQWEQVADVYVKKENPDLILLVPPQRFVDDGFRSLDWADDRAAFNNELIRQLSMAGMLDRVVELDDAGSDDDPDGYYARYVHAMQVITERLNVNMMTLPEGQLNHDWQYNIG